MVSGERHKRGAAGCPLLCSLPPRKSKPPAPSRYISWGRSPSWSLGELSSFAYVLRIHRRMRKNFQNISFLVYSKCFSQTTFGERWQLMVSLISWYPVYRFPARCYPLTFGVVMMWFLDVSIFREAVNSVMPLVCGSSRFACIECVFPEPLQGCYNVNAAVLFLDIYTKNSRWSWDAVDLIQSLLERRPKLKRCPLHEENCVTQLSFRYSFELINLGEKLRSSRWNLQRGLVETYVCQILYM